MKKSIGFIVAIMMLMSNVPISFAEEIDESDIPLVIYDGATDTFRYENVEGDPPDLFPNLKDLVPGDEYQEKIQLVITNLEDNEVVNIYIQATDENDHHEVINLMEEITYTVEVNGAEVKEDMVDTLYIGTFDVDETVDIMIDFKIPLTVGNEIQSLIAEVEWQFIAELIEEDGVESNPLSITPVTGDNNDLGMYLVMVILSVAIVLVLFSYKMKINKKSN
ncbi:MAG: hypothetical protein R3Y57_05455 [Erysipelotrichaceae bacterium]